MSEQTPYAIIETGSKQYRVQVGDVIDVEKVEGEESSTFKFSDVLLVHNGKEAKVGTPVLTDAVVQGEILGEVRGPKVIAYKYKKRKSSHRKVGHRQNYTRVKITELS